MRRRKAVLAIVMAFLTVVLVVQLWLLVGTIEAFLASEGLVGLPVVLASGVCLAAATWLIRSIE